MELKIEQKKARVSKEIKLLRNIEKEDFTIIKKKTALLVWERRVLNDLCKNVI